MATVVSKGSWTSDEDDRLCSAVEELGPKWALVANRVRTRNSGQCAKRWNDALNPTIDRSGWSREEDELLLDAVEKYGHSWASIARTSLPGRTGLAAKNRYNHLMRGSCRDNGKRTRRVSTAYPAPRRRTSRSDSMSSFVSGTPSPTWSASQSSGSEPGTVPSTPKLVAEGDEIHPPLLCTGADNAMPIDFATRLHTRLPSPLPLVPSVGSEKRLSDAYITSTPLHNFPEASSSALAFHDFSPDFNPYMYPSPSDVLGDAEQMDFFNMWSPGLSGPTTPAETAFFDPAFSLSQHAFETHETVAASGELSPRSSHGDSISTFAQSLAAFVPQEHRLSSPLSQSNLDISNAVLDAHLTVGCIPAFPDKASVHLTQPIADSPERRVAVAVAICDQQDILSTVHSLSQSLSTMLGQGQGINADSFLLAEHERLSPIGFSKDQEISWTP